MKKLTISIVASFAISVALAGNVTPPAVVTNAGTYSIEIAASNAPSVWTAVRPYIVADPKLLSALQAGATIGSIKPPISSPSNNTLSRNKSAWITPMGNCVVSKVS